MKDQKLLIHSLFSIIARFVGVGLNFLVRIVITRTLSMSEAGMLFLLMTFIPGVSLLSRIGLEQLIVKEVASSDENNHDFRSGFLINSYKIAVVSSLIITILWLLATPAMKTHFFHNEIALSQLMWAGASLFFFNLIIINTFYLKAIKRTITSVLMQNALPALCFLVLLGLFWGELSQDQRYIQLYILSIIGAGLASLFLTWPHFKKPPLPVESLPSLKTMTKDSLPLAPISFFSFVMLWADTLMVGLFLDNSQVALFNTAATISFVSLFFLGALDSTIYPRLLNIAKQNSVHLSTFFWQATLLVIFTLLSVTALMALFSAPILSAFGENYISAQSSLMILLLAQFLRATSLTFSFMFIIRDKVRYLNIILVISLLVNLVCNAFLIELYGMEGAAIATLIANGFLAISVILLFYWKKLLVSNNAGEIN